MGYALDRRGGLCWAGCMGNSPASPSLACSAPALGRTLAELGTLRNGLGSIQNLELLLKSIKVGQKGLFAAVAAVHADCGPMIESVQLLTDSLIDVGADASCARRLSDVLRANLTDLERVLAVAIRSGRLSVGQRLKLEHELSRSGRELGAILPLVSLIDRASRPRPLELTPVELVHAASAEGSEPRGIAAMLSLPAGCLGHGLGVDLDAAQMLVALGVALVVDGNPPGQAQVSFSSTNGARPVTSIGLGAGTGACVRIAALRLVAPSLLCAQVASRSLGGSFEYSPEARKVDIYWPPA
jgi:hypothetical protein